MTHIKSSSLLVPGVRPTVVQSRTFDIALAYTKTAVLELIWFCDLNTQAGHSLDQHTSAHKDAHRILPWSSINRHNLPTRYLHLQHLDTRPSTALIRIHNSHLNPPLQLGLVRYLFRQLIHPL